MEMKGIVLMFLCFLSASIFPRCSQAIALSSHAAQISAETGTIEAQNSICDIEAVVYSAEKSDTHPGYYDIRLRTKNIGSFKSQPSNPCDQTYLEKMEKEGQLLSASEYQSKPVSRGDTIKALAVFNDDGAISGYFLYDIQITGRTELIGQNNGQMVNSTVSDNAGAPCLAFAALSVIIVIAMAYTSRKRN